MTLSLGTAYRSFGGEEEASSTPTICRLPDSRRHQLWAIAHPEAFGSTFEIENAQTLSWFFDRLGTSTVLGAFCDTKLVAIVGFAIQEGQKRAHKGSLWGMYVRPGARGIGVGGRLVEAVLDLARQHVELIQLTVVQDNEQAR